uniref:Uncharacterized protein n=1 Tax=Macrostomum lignano TaxID=282301 RepID=A0A1I8IMG9_9PLAT
MQQQQSQQQRKRWYSSSGGEAGFCDRCSQLFSELYEALLDQLCFTWTRHRQQGSRRPRQRRYSSNYPGENPEI